METEEQEVAEKEVPASAEGAEILEERPPVLVCDPNPEIDVPDELEICVDDELEAEEDKKPYIATFSSIASVKKALSFPPGKDYPNGGAREKFLILQRAAKTFGELICTYVPESRERDQAIDELIDATLMSCGELLVAKDLR